MVPAWICYLSRRGLSKETMSSANSPVWEIAAPPAFALKPNNSIPSYMSLGPFELLPQSWSSEQVSPSLTKSTYRPHKRKVCNSLSPLSHLVTISTGFHSQRLWRLLFLALEPWAGQPSVWLEPPTPPGEHLQQIYFSRFCISTPLASLKMASSLCPKWQDCSARLQAALNDGF